MSGQTPEPDRVAQMDQACASFRDAGRMHAAYFKQLLTEGLERTEAVDLTIGYMNALMEREDPED